MTDACPCCGQTLPPKPPPLPGLSPIETKIFDALARAGQHGLATEQIFAMLYGDQLDGGPLVGHKNIQVHVSNMRKKLPASFTIAGSRYPSRYTLKRAEQ